MYADIVTVLVMGIIGAGIGLLMAGRLRLSQKEPADDPQCPDCGSGLSFSLNLPLLAWFVQFPRCRKCPWRMTAVSWPHEWIMEYLGVGRQVQECARCGFDVVGRGAAPMLAWVGLVARCPKCRAWLANWHSLLIPAFAVLWSLAALSFGVSVESISVLLFVTLLLGIIVTDAVFQIIPHEYTFAGFVVAVVRSLGAGSPTLLEGVLGAVTGGGMIWLVGALGSWWLKKEAMGTGDITMMTMVGMFLGWQGVLVTIFLGSLIGVIVAAPYALVKREKHLKVPFGVFLGVGALSTLIMGEQLLQWYLGFAF